MLRDHVNVRTHSVYIREEALSYGPRGPNGSPQWQPTDQAKVAVEAFLLTSTAYNEVVSWQPNARRIARPPYSRYR